MLPLCFGSPKIITRVHSSRMRIDCSGRLEMYDATSHFLSGAMFLVQSSSGGGGLPREGVSLQRWGGYLVSLGGRGVFLQRGEGV